MSKSNSTKNSVNQQNQAGISRRNFLKGTGVALGGMVLGGGVVNVLKGNSSDTASTDTGLDQGHDHGNSTNTGASGGAEYNHALMFFNKTQFETIEAACEQIFPEDANGPGAKKLGAAIFIDHQLAGPFGINAKEYRMGPFEAGEPQQGNQSPILNKDLILMGIEGLNTYSQQNYDKIFKNLEEDQQIEVLKLMEAGEIQLSHASGSAFFSLLLSLTIQGIYSDPLYGGNKNMEGWKMKKYPGNQMSYTDLIEKDEFVLIEPESLKDHMNH